MVLLHIPTPSFLFITPLPCCHSQISFMSEDDWASQSTYTHHRLEDRTKIQQKDNLLGVLNHFSRVQLFADPMNCKLSGSSVHGILRQEYWGGFPCPPPGDLPNPGIKPNLLCLLHWQAGSLPLIPPGKP